MSTETAADRLRLAIEMYEFGEQMQRSRLRRTRPDASDAEIEPAVQDWLSTRPDAPFGDAQGRPTRRFSTEASPYTRRVAVPSAKAVRPPRS